MSNVKHSLEFIKEEYYKKGYGFLEDSYKNRHYLHNIKCLTCGHIWKQRYSSLQGGSGCPKCAGSIKHSLEFIKEEYAKKNYVFLDDFYNNNQYPHNIKCHCGYEWKQTYGSLQGGHGCPKCYGNIKPILEFVKEEYAKKGYQFLDECYKNSYHKHNIKCLKCGYEWKQRYYNFQHKQSCPRCSKLQYKQTCLEKYGCENPMQDPEIALKAAKSQNNSYVRHHFLTNQELVCQASYEARVIDYLNSNKINYLWQPKTFKLSTGKTYRPDLYLVDLDLWVEVKGWMRQVSKEKWDEFHTIIQPNSELWDREKLIKLGINLSRKISR